MTHAVRVALIQERYHGSIDAMYTVYTRALQEAAQAGCQLAVLPELHQGSYFCQVEDPQYCAAAESVPGPTTDWLCDLAGQLHLVIVGSVFECRAPGLYHNTACVCDQDGTLAGLYRKMHIPDDPGFYEKFYFAPGDLGFTPIVTTIGVLGVLVCWDQWFPEAARLMAMAGAQLLIYPTAIGWDPNDDSAEQRRQLDAWITIQRSHAVANAIPVLACNRYGFEADPNHPATTGIQFWGHSFICGAQGDVYATAPSEQASVLIADVDLQRTEQVRRLWPFFRDRRIDAYQGLTRRWLDHQDHQS
jgi:N-carbamoylputrescine amidase